MKNQRVLAFALAALVVTVTTGVSTQDRGPLEGITVGDPARGVSLLAEARKALGGEDKLRAVKTLQVTGDFRRTAGSNQLDGELEFLIALPDKMKRIEDLSPPGGGPAIVATQVLNGTEVWDENTGGGRQGFAVFGGPVGGGPGGLGGGGVRGGFGGGFGGGRGGDTGGAPQAGGGQGRGIVDPERLRQARLRQRQADLSRLMLVWLLVTDAPVSWVGTAESPDGRADVVEIRPVDMPVTRLFLDEKSHLLLMITWQGTAPQLFIRGGRRGAGGAGGGDANQAVPALPSETGDQPAPGPPPDGQGARRGGPALETTLRMTLADYKAVGGIKLPRTITRGVNGQTNEEWRELNYKVNPSLKANTFDQKK